MRKHVWLCLLCLRIQGLGSVCACDQAPVRMTEQEARKTIERITKERIVVPFAKGGR
jgi:hypothetical protein